METKENMISGTKLNQDKIEDNAFMVMAEILNYENLYIDYFLNFTKNYFPDMYQILTTKDCRDFSVLAENIELIEKAVHTYLNEAMAIKSVSDRVADNHGYDRQGFQNYVMNTPALSEQMIEVVDAEISRYNGIDNKAIPTISADLVAGYEHSKQFARRQNEEKIRKMFSIRKTDKDPYEQADRQITIDM